MAYIWSLHISLSVMKGLTLGTPCKKEYFLGGRPQETRAAGPPACRALSAARRVPGLSRCPLWWTWEDIGEPCLAGGGGVVRSVRPQPAPRPASVSICLLHRARLRPVACPAPRKSGQEAPRPSSASLSFLPGPVTHSLLQPG